MTKRNTRNFDKPAHQVFKAIRNVIFKLGFEVKSTDKDTRTLKFVTKTSFIIFGGYEYVLNARATNEHITQVTLSTKSDVSQKNVDDLAETIFSDMDKELPVSQS